MGSAWFDQTDQAGLEICPIDAPDKKFFVAAGGGPDQFHLTWTNGECLSQSLAQSLVSLSIDRWGIDRQLEGGPMQSSHPCPFGTRLSSNGDDEALFVIG